jgi:hypothetical protein
MPYCIPFAVARVNAASYSVLANEAMRLDPKVLEGDTTMEAETSQP